jgi:outer membrane lipoprotein-sorting protein
MKLRIRYIFLLFVTFAIITTLLSFRLKKTNPISNNRELIDHIFEAVDNVKTLRFNLQCNERIKGRMTHYESKVKLQVAPRKLYVSLKGPEVLWIQGQNDGNALVNPGAFPFMNLNLDPYGSLMRKDQHHTIHEMGFQYLADILKDGLKRVGDKLDKYFVVVGEEKLNGRNCYKLAITFNDFAWTNYTVKKGENLTSIARKLRVSEYMVLMNNTKISWYNDVKEGQTIQVPNAYGKLTILLIDKESLLPVSNKVFDDQGLYETYEYQNLEVNTTILPEEFTKEFKDYNF